MKTNKGLALLMVIGICGRAGAAEPSAKPAPPDAVAKEPAAITRTTVLPCPLPKPAFDPVRIDRTLKEPKYVSEKPLYRFFVFGPAIDVIQRACRKKAPAFSPSARCRFRRLRSPKPCSVSTKGG